MAVSLRTRLVVIMVGLSLGMAVVISLSVLLSFRHLIRQHLLEELREEASDFSELVDFSGGKILIRQGADWLEPEHKYDSDHARYMVITDTLFNTVQKSANLGDRELQYYFDLHPEDHSRLIDSKADSIHFVCFIRPLTASSGVRYGYVLSATNTAQTSTYISILERTSVIVVVMAIFAGGLMAVFLARRITRPLMAIESIAAGMDLSSLDQRITVKSKEAEIKNLTKSLNQLFERLQRSVRQINEFSSNVSHELRTPLTILRGNIEVGLSRDRTPDEYVSLLSDLLEETMHVIKIIDDMLLLARADNRALMVKREPIDLAQFCMEFKKDWEIFCAAKKQPLTCTVAEGIRVEADRTMLYQMILNLISNASKYSPDGSEIEVSVLRTRSETGHSVEIRIADHGRGIPSDDLAKVFDRFYRVDKDRSQDSGGIGLGLSITKMIAELHGGQVSLESIPGRGTTVTVFLPEIFAR